MIAHNPTCVKCGTTLAKCEIKHDPKNGKIIARQKCFRCSK